MGGSAERPGQYTRTMCSQLQRYDSIPERRFAPPEFGYQLRRGARLPSHGVAINGVKGRLRLAAADEPVRAQ